MKARSLFPTALAMALLTQASAQTARVQVIHNCAEQAAAEVDVWLNDILLLDDFAFRTATPFVDAPAGVPFTVGIAPASSASASESIFEQTFTLEVDGSYILVAGGIVSPEGYMPAPAFSLEVFSGAREEAVGPGTDLLVYHGSTDAPAVDVYEAAVLNATVIEDLAYTNYAGYLEVPTVDLTVQVRTADNSTIVAAYDAPLATLGLEGQAITVIASGFIDPAMNSDGAAFGLFAVPATGGGFIALPAAALPDPARVQVIHNSADAAAAEVDVYLNGSLLLDDFAFRTATPFVDLPSGVDLSVAIAPGNSTSVADAIATYSYQLETNGTYVIIANGIVSATGYQPTVPFDLYVAEGREQAAMAGNTDILVFHGVTDAPTVDVAEIALLGGAVIVDDLAYGETSAGYLEVGTADLALQVQTTDGTPVTVHDAPLASLGLENTAIVVLASGFLDPTMNGNGAPFGLWVALPTGGPLVELSITTAIDEGVRGSFTIWPNPATEQVMIDLDGMENATVRVLDNSGRIVGAPLGMQQNGGLTVLDLKNYPAGSYILEITTGAGIGTAKLFIEK